jgi:hypothetical protein
VRGRPRRGLESRRCAMNERKEDGLDGSIDWRSSESDTRAERRQGAEYVVRRGRTMCRRVVGARSGARARERAGRPKEARRRRSRASPSTTGACAPYRARGAHAGRRAAERRRVWDADTAAGESAREMKRSIDWTGSIDCV